MNELDFYPWSGHSVLMGKRTCSFQTMRPVLSRFASKNSEARKLYRRFIEEGIKTVSSEWIVEAVRASNRGIERGRHPGCWVIGEQEFVMSVLKKNEDRLRSISLLRQRWSLDAIAEVLGKKHKLHPEEIIIKSNRSAVSAFRKRFSYISCRIIGFPVAAVARYLNQSSPAVSWQIKTGKEVVTKADIELFTFLPPG